jgi:hypothetical protein
VKKIVMPVDKRESVTLVTVKRMKRKFSNDEKKWKDARRKVKKIVTPRV